MNAVFFLIVAGLSGGVFVSLQVNSLLERWYYRFLLMRRMRVGLESTLKGTPLPAHKLWKALILRVDSLRSTQLIVKYFLNTKRLADEEKIELETYYQYKYGLSLGSIVNFFVLLAVFFLVILLLFAGLLASSEVFIAALCLFGLFVLLVPRVMGQKIKKYRHQIEYDMQEFLTMLALLIRAGTSFNRAIFEYLKTSESLLSGLIKPRWETYQSGTLSRSEVLENITHIAQVEILHKACKSINHGLNLGSPLSVVLENQLEDFKELRKKRIEEEISKISVKILVPLGLCILPAMLILLLGPVLMEVLHGINS